MKTKIFKNRQVLQGKTFLVSLNKRFYYFQIRNVSNKEIKIAYHMKYDEINNSNPNSIEGIVKKFILENSSDIAESFDRRVFKSSVNLRRVPVIIDGMKFKLNNITNSYLDLEKVIELDELLESDEYTFLGTVKRNVINNLLENPPPIEKIRMGDDDTYFNGWDYVHFKTLDRQIIGTPKKLDDNEKREKLREKREIYKENKKKLREINPDNSSHTRELARYR